MRIVARQAPPGGRHAEHRSRDLGTGMEFRDFRPYAPGDDLRRVDWNLYRRSGRLFLRLFEETEDLPISILLDISDSMFFETPPRADAARQVAAVIAAVALRQQDRVELVPFGERLGDALPVSSGKAALPRVLDFLEQMRGAGPTDFVHAVRQFAARPQRPGLVVVISDFFDPGGAENVVAALRSLRHRLALIRLVRQSDAEPDLRGELRLLDCEGGGRTGVVDVSVTEANLARYHRAYREFEEAMERFATRRRAVSVSIDADRPVLEQLGRVFVGGVLRV
jgi:uncharacterized protein (DUF58 family)